MKNFNQLPGAMLMLCWAAVVKSDNSALSPVFANSTTSQTASSSTSTASGSASITSAASSSSSLDSAAPTFTGTDPDDLTEWCITQYEAYVNASGTPTVILTTTNTGFYYDGPLSDITVSSSEWSSAVTITSTIIPPGYTSPPQCLTGCVIAGNFVDLEYWPTPRPAPNATTSSPSMITSPPAPLSAVVDGMTLYSPSNYLIFTNISAAYCAIDLSPCTTIGSVVSITTLSFGQNELSTEDCMHETSALNYMDFNSPIPWSIVTNQYGCTILTETHPGSYLDSTYTLKPSIVFPSEVKTAINPDWAQCTFNLGLLDPPSALTPVQQLTAGPRPGTTTAVQPSSTVVLTPSAPAPQPQSTASSAIPGPTITSTLVPVVPTSTAIPDPSSSSVIPDPPNSTPIPDPQTTTSVAITPASSITPPTDPVDPASSSPEATLPGKSNFDPSTSPSSTPLASIIASVGGFGNDPPPASTITLPAQSPTAGIAPLSSISSQAGGQPASTPSTIITTLSSQVISVAPGISSTIPGQVVTIQPDPASTGSSALITTLPSQVISVAPGISTTIPGQIITVSPGLATTIPKIIISIGGSLTTIPAVTISASASPQRSSSAALPPVTATIGGQIITIAPDGQSATISSQTVTAGGTPITVSGTTVSIGSSSIVVGSTTVAIITPPPTSTSLKGSGTGYLPGSNATASLAVQASVGNRIALGPLRGSVFLLGLLVGLGFWIDL